MSAVQRKTYWICTDCGQAWAYEELARQCCAQTYCEGCGAPIQKHMRICEGCRLGRAFDEAMKIKEADYNGWVWCPEYYIGNSDSDGYFPNVQELIEHCDAHDIPFPEWAYTCTRHPVRFDLDQGWQWMIEDAYDGIEYGIVDADELESFITKWNSKQKAFYYLPDKDLIVLIDVYGWAEKG